uniref:Pre-mRNA cleavage complex 2 protein Pcf11 n=1 Tax=Parasteatoda tepidariorum TaxID=114398 RepID=A0A2L2YI49_PARTP
MRFKNSQGEQYGRHLDWHFRMNRREKDGAKKAFSRRLFYNVKDWEQFIEIEEAEERAPSYFELQADCISVKKEEAEKIHSVRASECETEKCFVCGEQFQLFWVEEEEEWHLRNAVRHDNEVFHPACYEDFIKASKSPIADTSKEETEDEALDEKIEETREKKEEASDEEKEEKNDVRIAGTHDVRTEETHEVRTEETQEVKKEINEVGKEETSEEDKDMTSRKEANILQEVCEEEKMDVEESPIQDDVDVKVPIKEEPLEDTSNINESNDVPVSENPTVVNIETTTKIKEEPMDSSDTENIAVENNSPSKIIVYMNDDFLDYGTEEAMDITTNEPSEPNNRVIEDKVIKAEDKVIKAEEVDDRTLVKTEPTSDDVESDEFRPPTPDPRFDVQPPIFKGTELSALCTIM